MKLMGWFDDVTGCAV